MAAIHKRLKSFLKKTEPSNFVRNGGLLMEKLISLSNGLHEIHIKRFTIQEITQSTNNFVKLLTSDSSYKLFKGNLDGRPILVKICDQHYGFHSVHSVDQAVYDTALSALMSHLKYTLKLIGCCTDYEFPASVYEYAGSATTLTALLGENLDVALSWRNRIKIARDVAGMVVYLHTCFPQTIIHRDLKTSNVLVDQNGDAKLFNFSLTIETPPGESKVETDVAGTIGFLDPEYAMTGLVTTKSDVFSFGVILLMLLTGKKQPYMLNEEWIHPSWSDEERNEAYSSDAEGILSMSIRDYVKHFIDIHERIIDQSISQEVGMDEFRAIRYLALSCTEEEADKRPEMIDVARRLHEIEKQVNKPSCGVVPPFVYNCNALRKNVGLLL